MMIVQILFFRNIVIEDENKRENNTLRAIYSWQVIFTENDEDAIVSAKVLVAENTTSKLTRYIECYKLLRIRSEIALNQLEHKESNAQRDRDPSLNMNEVQNQLKEYDSEYRTILDILNFHKFGIDDISTEWIAENMLNIARNP